MDKLKGHDMDNYKLISEKQERGRWDSYDGFIANLSRAVVTTAEQASTMTVEIATSVIAITSIAPELIGLHAKTGNWWLALPVALTGIGSVHAAVLTKRRYMWAVFALHFLAVEGILFYFAGLAAEMAYPLISIVGAVIMASAVDHKQQVKRSTKLEDVKLDFDMDEKRKDNDVKRKIKLEKERAKLSQPQRNSGVTSTVTNAATSDTMHPSDRQAALLDLLRDVTEPGDINVTQIARTLGVHRQTVYRDMESLKADGVLSVNGHVEVTR